MDAISALDGAGYPARSEELRLAVSGMSCASCVGRLDRALRAEAGVVDVNVNLADESATLRFVPGATTAARLAEVATKTGYPARIASQEDARDHGEIKQAEAEGHRRAMILAAALTIPVFAYNAPGFTGMTLSGQVVEKISRHPNIGGMKDTSPSGIAGSLEVCGDNFDVLAGTMNTLFIGLSLGASGGVISLANGFPEPCCELYKKYVGGDVQGARQLHSRLFRLNQAVSGKSGVAGVKYAMELGGYFGGAPRLPLRPLQAADQGRIEKAAREAGLI